jgi:hypothetical protein
MLRSKALGKENAQLQFSLGPDDQTGWGGISLGKGDGKTITVPVVRLDEIFGSDTQINVLKVDIEGADTWAILGVEKLLRAKRIKHVYFEENASRMNLPGIKAGEAQAYLHSLGYRVELFGREKGEYHASPE